MGNPEPEGLTEEEAKVREAYLAYVQAMGECAQAGGDPQKGTVAAIPPEIRAQMVSENPMLAAFGL